MRCMICLGGPKEIGQSSFLSLRKLFPSVGYYIIYFSKDKDTYKKWFKILFS